MTIEEYIDSISSNLHPSLDWLEKQTHIRTNYGRMLSGKNQGLLLKFLVSFLQVKEVLEIGTFTGYSTICMGLGLPKNGHIDTFEINDELEDLIYDAIEKANLQDKIDVHYGDFFENFRNIDNKMYDFVYIDANKREYLDYYKAIIDRVKPNGCIIADDVLWNNKVLDSKNLDKQTKGIIEFNDFVVNDHRVEVVVLPIRHGLSVIRKKY